MTEFTSSYIPCVPHPLMYEKKDDLYLLLHSQKPIWTVVNRLGFEIASLCDGERTIQDIASHIADRYRQDLDPVYADLVVCLTRLQQAGFLYGEDENDENRGNGLGPAGEWPARSMHLHISLTETCNLRCIHCLVMAGSQEVEVLSRARIYRLIDELASGDSVTISGGEPLLRQDCLDILTYASSRAETYFATNATLINESIAAALAKLDIVIQISLDGSTPTVHDRIRGKGTFRKTMRAVEMLHEHGFAGELTFNMTVMRPNVADVVNVIDLAEQMKVGVYLAPLLRMGRADSSWSDLYLTPDEYAQLYTYIYRELPRTGRGTRVGAGLQGFKLDISNPRAGCTIGQVATVDSKGDVYPCPLLTSPEFYLGNIKQMSLRQIMASPKLREMEVFCTARKTRIEECRHCNWRNFCQAGCPASVLLEKGTMLGTDDLCDVRRHLYRETLFDLVAHKLKLDDVATESAC